MRDGPRDQWVWLANALLVLGVASAGAMNYIFRDAWRASSDPAGRYGPFILAATFAIVAGCAAWLAYDRGTKAIQEQAESERQYRMALEHAYLGTLHALTAALDLRDDETYGHSRRVMELSTAIGRRLGLDDEAIQTLAWGALLHDLGKIGIRDQILLKPGQLTADEEAVMRQHVVIGHQLVQHVPFLARTADLVRHHHERFDGKGYPDRLRGTAIPLLARIFAVADALDAMTSPRPYRAQPFSLAEALGEIKKEAGKQFCPDAVAALTELSVEELESIRNRSYTPVQRIDALVPMDIAGQVLQDFYRDLLTGTHNRTAWEAKRTQMNMIGGRRLGTVVFFDMNRLKELNDTYGHATGDRVLSDLGARLTGIFTEVYRIGGDEFVVWLRPEEWTPGLEQKLNDILESFADYWCRLTPDISVSWGIATADDRTTGLDSLIRAADAVMYAKKAGAARPRPPDEPAGQPWSGQGGRYEPD